MRAGEAAGADLIVVGRRGRNTFERLILGSVSERILRFAHCPVLVVH
jgi:nucleotide-binding universal stress UspA family protein